jgi:hypothetical protein
LRCGRAADADVEISRGQPQLPFLRLQQHIRENRQRGARAHDVLHGLQTFEKFVFANAKFHTGAGLRVDE